MYKDSFESPGENLSEHLFGVRFIVGSSSERYASDRVVVIVTTVSANSSSIADEDRVQFFAACLALGARLYPALDQIREYIDAEGKKLKRYKSVRKANPDFQIDPRLTVPAPGTVRQLAHRFSHGLPYFSLSDDLRLYAGFCKIADRVCYGRKLDNDAFLIWHLLACSEALGVVTPTDEELLEAAMASGSESRHTPGELDARGESHCYDVALEKWGKRLERHKKKFDAYSLVEEQGERLAKLIEGCPSDFAKARMTSRLQNENRS